MKRTAATLFAFLLLLACTDLYAAPVSKKDAATVAYTWLNAKKGKKPADKLGIESIEVLGENQTLFVVHFQDGGFVLVSADDNVQPILGYSSENTFPTDHIPVNVAGWLARYDLQISHAAKMKSASEEVQEQWQLLLSGKLPNGIKYTEGTYLISAQWAQDCYYNDFCPSDPSGYCGNALVGCVAVAMGQIMYYHQHPAVGLDSMQYTCDYGDLKVVFADQVYDWASMKDALNSSDVNSEVAKLLYHCGVAVEMDYGPNASGSYSLRVVTALSSFFDYQCRKYEKGAFEEQEWIDMIKEEIDRSRPLYYSGNDGYSGHAFVCDGYDNDYFHFNWGWEGSYNGFYELNELNNIAGYDFSQGQSIILIQPDDYEVCLKSSMITASKLFYGNSHDYTMQVENQGPAWTGDLFINLYDQDYKFVETIGTTTALSLDSGDTYSTQYSHVLEGMELGFYYFRAEMTSNGELVDIDRGSFSNPPLLEIALGKPQGLEASDSLGKKIKVDWTSVPGAQYYQVYRSSGTSPYWADEASDWIPDTSFTDSLGLDNYQEMNYWVKASTSSTGSDASLYSNMATGRTTLMPPNITASANIRGYISLSWANDDPVSTYYQIMRSLNDDFSYAQTLTGWVKDVQGYKDADVEPGQDYYYWIRAAYDTLTQVSPYDGPQTATLEMPPPENLALSANGDENYIRLSWSEYESDTMYYQIIRSTSNDINSAAAITGWLENTAGYNDYEVGANQVYYYWLRAAYDTLFMASTYSGPGSSWLKITPPDSIMASKGEHEDYILVRWDKMNDNLYYKVYRSTQPEVYYSSAITSWIQDTNITDTDINEGIYYYYWTRIAIDSKGTYKSEYSMADTGYVAQDVSIDEYTDDIPYRIYPNPADQILFIEHHSANKGIEALIITINDISGRQLYSKNCFSEEKLIKLDISSLKPGVYYINLQNGHGCEVKQFLVY